MLAALRIRLKGSDGGSLDDLLTAADDPGPDALEAKLAEIEGAKKPSLDDLLSGDPKPKPAWPG